jgi:recombination protein RecT
MDPKKNENGAATQQQPPQVPAIVEKNICDNVLARVNQFQQAKEIRLPENYSAENALKSAFLILKETVDREKKPVLEVCTKESIANTLLDMVVQGLSPIKKQCYFIAYGNKLQLSRSYQGSIVVAKRVGLKDIVANVIYEGDAFEYEINPETGRKRLLKHDQDFMNIDLKKIKGAYALYELTDGTKDMELMNINQIHKAWEQGAAKGNSGAHTNFTDEMCKKTVYGRACKSIINSSDDANLFNEDDDEKIIDAKPQVNIEEIGFTDLSEQKEIPQVSEPLSVTDEAAPVKETPKDLFDANSRKPGF